MDSPYLFLYQNTYKDLHLPAFIIAGCFSFAAIFLSLFLTFQHLRSYTNPSEQKWIVAVLFMVPVYATESILSLWNAKLSLVCDILRNCYEAFALYAFGSYLIACLGGERQVIDLLEDEARKQISKPLLEEKEDPQSEQKTFRNFILRPCVLGEHLFTIIKFGLVQYMIMKTLCAFLAFILELFGVYGDGSFKWYYGYPYITIVLNFSQMWALYCLIQFYNVTHRRLEPIKPLAKFISFKAIVFATWWQGVGIVLLCTFRVLPKEGKFQTGLQDFLICIEMAIAAVAHIFVFSAKPYHFIPAYHYGKITTQETKAMVKIEEGDKEKPALLEKRETIIEAPGTSVKESVQDIVVEGGQKVMEDVVLTINQAIEPVHEGMTKIQETFHHMSVSSDSKDKPEVKVEEVEQNITIKPEV
ncbi:protein LAZ1 homolog 2 isoform X1 [Sesamum indicum]|uniref:Protein LAZ1 homolog 2 isoform X1 n=1 Tax=Sesamum indicum TaxID=4182 RepID=A0A6I9T4Z6_SESIN|nr:protein LAZ1 homolog 2 isoform X1 [Sesamum indicum]XP_011078103.1 protein LAZ1 homolog 2 isoform X1 [Sesamum indicum]